MLSGSSGGGGGGVSSAIAQFEVFTATNPSYQLSNGARYIPLTEGATDTMEMQCCAPVTGTASVVVVYSMSASNAGNVEIYLDRRISSDADDLNAAVTSGTQFTITPGSNTTRNVVDSGDSSDLTFSVTEGQTVYLKLGRTADAADTHTADMRVFAVYMKVAP